MNRTNYFTYIVFVVKFTSTYSIYGQKAYNLDVKAKNLKIIEEMRKNE